MTSGNSSTTPVKVPSSVASYTPATLDADIRSQINTLLIRDGHVTKIQDHLLHSLHAHPSNWPTAVQSHALSLLRSGEVTTFPALIQRVMDDVRHDSSFGSGSDALNNGNKGEVNGTGSGDASTSKANGQALRAGEDNKRANLALPPAVVEEALRVTRESLEMVCEIDDGDGTT
ncbi:hypothetical protein VTK73DRAFT_5886 [Phialemonium thermophilum]|uniref:Uncharacterized protein n=1 Tax=Phialemonium thermophilum TaxID=223376 RepID=A0ABR3XXN5_9PEZI